MKTRLLILFILRIVVLVEYSCTDAKDAPKLGNLESEDSILHIAYQKRVRPQRGD